MRWAAKNSCSIGLWCLLATALMLSADSQAQEQIDPELALAAAVNSAIEFASPAVVQIETIGGLTIAGESQSTGPFSGTVVSSDGFILTASYNLRHEPASISVRVGADRVGADRADRADRYVAEVIAKDTSRNLTLLKIDRNDLIAARFADQNSIQQGQTSIALGKYVSPTQANISLGIVSATGRVWNRAVQTDCKISRQNYGGPLISLRGEVLGILVPLSPNAEDVAAGSEWYDSGIGFAAVVDVTSEPFLRLKSGQQISAGRAGLSFEGIDENADPAKISFCLPTSPAGKAGLKIGDTIVAANGFAIERQAQFRHAIGSLYDGQVLKVKAKRESEADAKVDVESQLKSESESEPQLVEANIELAAKIDPYIEPEFGILIDRSKEGLVVEAIFPDSPAEDSELQVGDRILRVNDVAVQTIAELRSAIAGLLPGDEIKIETESDEASMIVGAILRRQTAAPEPTIEARRESATETEIVELSVAEASNKCFAIVPKNSDAKKNSAAPVLVWVPDPGPVNRAAIQTRFAEYCQTYSSILLVAESVDPESWRSEDAAVIAKLVEQLGKRHSIDAQRIAIAGAQAGGRMALLTAFSNRKLFRGCIVIDGELTTRLPNFRSLPTTRLHLLAIGKVGSDVADEMRIGVDAYREQGFSIHLEQAIDSDEPELIFRWLQILDRL